MKKSRFEHRVDVVRKVTYKRFAASFIGLLMLIAIMSSNHFRLNLYRDYNVTQQLLLALSLIVMFGSLYDNNTICDISLNKKDFTLKSVIYGLEKKVPYERIEDIIYCKSTEKIFGFLTIGKGNVLIIRLKNDSKRYMMLEDDTEGFQIVKESICKQYEEIINKEYRQYLLNKDRLYFGQNIWINSEQKLFFSMTYEIPIRNAYCNNLCDERKIEVKYRTRDGDRTWLKISPLKLQRSYFLRYVINNLSEIPVSEMQQF